MNYTKIKKAFGNYAGIATAVAMAASSAIADVNVQLFTPSSSTSYMMTEDTMVDGYTRTYTLGVTYNYLNRPLVELSPDRKERRDDLVRSLNTLNILGGYFITDRWFVGADLALNMVTFPSQAAEFAMGDTRVFTKVRLTDLTAPLSIALMPELFVPTGESQYYLTDGSVGAGLKALAERDFGVVRVAGNVGYRYTSDGQFRDINYRNRLSAGLGGSVRLARMWFWNLEGTGTITLPKSPEQNPGEVYTGLMYKPRNEMTFAVGGAIGSVNGVGSSDYRIVAGIKFLAVPPPAVIATAPVQAPKPVMVSAVVKKPVARVFFEKKQIRVTEEIKFEHNSAQITESGKRLLDEVAEAMKENLNNFKRVTVEGHTNAIGSHAYNNKLSRERAASVREYLMSRGVAGDRLSTIGYGKTQPKKIAGLSRQARLDADRRVEFKVVDYSAAEVSAIRKKAEQKAAASGAVLVTPKETKEEIDRNLDAPVK